MSAQDTPRAFPSAAIDDAFGGMTLRDWFAGQALIALVMPFNGPEDSDGSDSWWPVAERAYEVTDAMMEERDRRG